MSLPLGVLGIGLVVIEHIAQEAVGFIRIRADAHQVGQLVAAAGVRLGVLGGLVVHDDVISRFLVIDGLGIVVVENIVGELGDRTKAPTGLVKLHRKDIEGAHHPGGIVLQCRLNERVVVGTNLIRNRVFQRVILRVRGRGPGEDHLVPGVHQTWLAVGGMVILHRPRHRPGVVCRVVNRPFELCRHDVVPAGFVVQKYHQEAVVADADDLGGGLGVGVLHDGSGPHGLIRRHELTVPGDPLGIHVAARVVADAAAVIIILGHAVDDHTGNAALGVHLDGVFGGPFDDAVIIGVVLELIGLAAEIVAVHVLLGIHHGPQLDDQLPGPCLGRVAALSLRDAAFHIGDALRGPAVLLEVVHEAARQGQGPTGLVHVDGGDDQVQRAGEGRLRHIAKVAVKELRVPFGHVVAVAELEGHPGAHPHAQHLIEAHADGDRTVEFAVDLAGEAEILALKLVRIEAVQRLLGVALGAQEEGDVEARVHIDIGRNKDDDEGPGIAAADAASEEAARAHVHHIVALFLGAVIGDLHIAVVQIEADEPGEGEVRTAKIALDSSFLQVSP